MSDGASASGVRESIPPPGEGRADAQWSWAPALALALACVLWAGSSIAAKVALGSSSAIHPGKLGPFTLASVRFGVGGALLFAYLRARGQWPRISPSDRLPFAALGAFGIALTYAVFYAGMRFTTATETTLLVAAEPLLIALLARTILAERLTARQNTGLMTGFAGVYLIVVRGLIPRVEGTVIANGVVALALVFEAYSSIVGKKLTMRYPGLAVASIGMMIGAVLLGPFAAYEIIRLQRAPPGIGEAVAVAYLTLVCSCLCYGIWYSLLRRYTVSSMAGFLFIQPLLGPIYGYILLHETLTRWSAAGAALIVLGVWLVASRTRGSEAVA